MLSNQNGSLTLLNVNIRSIGKNLDTMKLCLKTLDHKFTAIGLSETHLKEKPLDYCQLPGYNFEYVNRVDREKGGVGIFIANNVKYKLRHDLCKANSHFESCFIETERSNVKNVLIGVIYRAHTAIDNFVHDVDPILQTISKEKQECYIMGDYNIDLLKDDSDRPTHDYLDVIYSHCLIPSILFPTRITEKSATIIDNILTNSDNEIMTRILVTDITDHFPTILMTKSNNKNVTKDSINEKCFAYKRTYTKDNISHLKQKLSQENWNDILHGIDAECDYNMFIERFNKLYDECIPLKKYKVNRRKIPKSLWITKGILKSITTKYKLYKEYLRSPKEQQAVKFKTYRNKLNNLIRKSKREYFYSKFRNIRNNIKETSKTINSIIGRRKNRSVQSTFKTEQVEKLTDPKIISDAFNTFFVDIGPKLASKIQHTGKNYFDYLNQPASSCMYTKPVVPEEVVKIIAKFNQNKSPGHDDIGNMIVKK